MMGCQGSTQDWLFYSFNLDDQVPRGHLVRGLDRYLELGEMREQLASFYSHTGRPSIDPELMLRMLLLGYCFGIRSERRLCEEVQLNLAYRWFCRLDLEDAVPNHSTFSKNRHGRFRDSDVFRLVFEGVLRRCMREGLVRGEGFAIDASIIKADANRARGLTGSEATDWSGGERTSRAVREYFEALETANPIEDDGSSQPKNVSLTDPAARWTAAPGGPAAYAYSTNYLIDLEAGVIVDVEATPAHRTAEVESTKTMVERVEKRFGLKPGRLVGDTAYGTGPLLAWMVQDKKIAPHVPVWDKARRKDGSLEISDFAWDAQANEYRCPQGHALRSDRRQFKIERDRTTKADTVIYRASQADCADCPSRQNCCPNTPMRKIARSVHEDSRAVARNLSGTPEFAQSRNERKKVEVLFAHLKRIMRLDRLRLRGLNGAHDEFLLAATAQNLRRMAKRLAAEWTSGNPMNA